MTPSSGACGGEAMSAVSAGHRAPIATTSAQVRCVRPATGIADPASLLPLRVAMPSSVGPCHRSRDLLPARRTAQPVPVRHPRRSHAGRPVTARASRHAVDLTRRRSRRSAGSIRGIAECGDAPRLTLSRDGTVRTLRTQRNTSWSRVEWPSPPAGAPACASGRDASQAIRRWSRSQRGLRCTDGTPLRFPVRATCFNSSGSSDRSCGPR